MSDSIETIRKIYRALGLNKVRKFLHEAFRVAVSPYYVVTTPLRRKQHKELQENCDRSQSHTYTSFYRSPLQLEAIVGPVIDFFDLNENSEPLEINIFAASNGAEAYTIASELIHKRPNLKFRIIASDLHDETVDKANSGCYTRKEIIQRTDVPTSFINRTFDRQGDLYCVKPEIKQHVTFCKADLLDPELEHKFDSSDVVMIQNVLFHLDNKNARYAFNQVSKFLKPKSALFLDGMDLDMKIELTKSMELTPLDYRVREIYSFSRRHVPNAWWKYYYGSEPYIPFSDEKTRRYSTIFFKDESG